MLLKDMVLWFYGLMVLWFYGFKKYKVSISCFQEDIDLISIFFEILFSQDSSCFGARLFGNCQNCGFPKCRDFIKVIFEKMAQCFFLIFVRCPGVSKDK